MYYSKTTGGFYSKEIHGDAMPPDVVEISSESHADLLEKQSLGMQIVADEKGFPITLSPPEPSGEQLAATIRTQRNRLLQECDWTQLADCPLSDADLIEWQAYRQELRDVTEQESFPLSVTWPTAPN